MATATRQSAADQFAGSARYVGVREPMEFLIFEANDRAYRWEIILGDGATVAQSEDFASRDHAEQAAQRVGKGVGSARLDHRAHEVRPLNLPGGRDGSGDELDAERWLDEDGSFTGEAVAR